MSRGARADLKLLKGATDLPADAQEAALARIKKEGADAKKATQAQKNAKRNAPGAKAKPGIATAPDSPAVVAESPDRFERPKASFGDFLTPKMARA